MKNRRKTRRTRTTTHNTASRGRGNSEVEQQLENEPTQDVAMMEINIQDNKDGVIKMIY
jgi:hypothetical protein